VAEANPYACCRLCPRACAVDRAAAERGYCGETSALRVAAASIHRGEEPPIVGSGGSGTVFISGCNLGCVFCQNHQISQEGMGRALSIEAFARICLSLEQAGAENINIVTGSHAIPALVAAIQQARTDGLTVPVLWNSSAYETPEALALLADVVSGYLPDLKTLDSALATRFFNAPDYPAYAQRAILTMLSQQGSLRYADGVLQRGVIVRHLALPGCLDDTRQVLRWFAEHCKGKALLSLMTQYTPVAHGTDAPQRFIDAPEYATLLTLLEEYGIDDGFLQELSPDSSWLPDFSRHNPFDSTLSVPIWHWNAEQ
jgi:putative pyruvate formate lyase activating enzyme